MSVKSYENLKAIRFAGELLPNWAQLLDLAARLCLRSQKVRSWFSRFTTCSGVDDARTVIEMCSALRAGIAEHREFLAEELRQNQVDGRPEQIIAAWMYSLDTMIQEAETRKTCPWIIEGTDGVVTGDSDGGDITLRRV
jgi:hypothetical protein